MASQKTLSLERILHSQGFGSRKICRAMIEAGRVSIQGLICDSAQETFDTDHFVFTVDETEWTYTKNLYIVLNKPSGYECSRSPQHHPSVLSLLPVPWVMRGVQCVGRLDQDTTGLLLLTDDGQWLHALSSPRRHVPKTYRVTTKHPVAQELIERVLVGVELHDDPVPVAAIACVVVDEHVLDLTIAEGRYHQVKRMIAAAGNRVEHLHRLSIGGYALPPDLEEGQVRELSKEDIEHIYAK